VASGEKHTIREFVEESFKVAGVSNVRWDNDILYLINEQNEREFMLIKTNSSLCRPAEVETLMGDPSLIKNELNWVPKTSFQGLVKKMVENDLKTN
jgi:GDPmannose 4,6-dehydratase